MNRITNLFLIVIIIRTTSFFAGGALQPQPQHHHGGGCDPAERAALLSFKMGITNDSNNLLGSWRGQDCCRWRGVECSNQSGQVVKLHLRNLNPDLFGGCSSANALYGEISPSLLSLKHLEHIDLSMNCLLGPLGHIPHFLGSFENLRYLNISGIRFTGRVPSQLGNLSKLQYLDLGLISYYEMNSNDLVMYSTDITWLTRLPLLQYLRFSKVNLSGIADWPRMLNMIPSLRSISLSNCLLESANQSLPHFNLTKLEKLDLSWNYLGHSVASGWFWKATKLTYLNLKSNQLLGQFPDAIGNMTSLQVLDLSDNYLNKTINLKNLCSLKILDVSSNEMNIGVMEWLLRCKKNNLQELHFGVNLFGGTIPNFIGQFTSLRVLDLSLNHLDGPILPVLGNLKCLTTLDLSNNDLVGPIPPSIGDLKCLTTLDLSMNELSGSIPAELGKLRYLNDLELWENKFTGPIPPHVMHLTRLVMLDLQSNHLNGSVPTEIGSLPNLIYLNLADNNFSGVITEEHLAGLKSLKNIDISSNNLKVMVNSDWLPPFSLMYARFASCQMGPLFPAWLQRLETIGLNISSTGLTGEIPDWFWSTFSQATHLDMSNNQINGSLPANFDGMAVINLYLGSNQLTGQIPSLPTNIVVLDISNNTLSGTLPSNLGDSQLQTLHINANQIGGYIPQSICKLQLSHLDLSNNVLEGEIPQCFDGQSIHILLLGNNSLSGKFPVFLRNSTDLKFLDLSWNKFSGILPTWIGELQKLRFLLLGHNIFSDNIPAEITNLGNLQYLDLSSNNFSGAIPWHLTNLTMMKILQNISMLADGTLLLNYLEFPAFITEVDHITGVYMPGGRFSVVTKGQQLTYGRTFVYFVGIDLSDNFLTGKIPTDITSLASLMNLNLSSNLLSGEIPRMIGAMQSLTSLDLSKNKLSGEIPSSLSNLSSLSYLNLSYNNLYGRIPSGHQLDTLAVDNPSLMYIGNSGLCGPPLQKSCSRNNTSIHGHLSDNKQEFEPMTFYFGLVLGLVAGHWVVFCTLLFKKTWRIAYFRFFGKLYDTIYVFVVVKWGSFMNNATSE